MKTMMIALTAALLAAPTATLAQSSGGQQRGGQKPPASPAAPAAQAATAPPGGLEVSGMIVPAVQQFESRNNSSKLTEYRDFQDGFYLPKLLFSLRAPASGRFFSVTGENVSRDDQTIVADGGQAGVWSVQAVWAGVPHNFSNRAVTPYIRRGPGLFEVPATVPITFKRLATSVAADVPGVLASDELIAAYQRGFLRPTDLRTQDDMGRLSFAWTASEALSLGVSYRLQDREGLRSTYGPIGDRPPRTLNIQLTEPVDQRTNELQFSAEHRGGRYEVRGEYLFSDFANAIDTLTWQNIYTTAAPGSTYDVWDRAVSTYGRRPLSPDNRFHNVSAAFGADLPVESRVMASAAYGRMEQNETLLPYAYANDVLAVRNLPRQTAEARMNTTSLTADYVITPWRRVNLRAFYRRYDLRNDTPSSQWQYVTSDTSNLNGTVSYVNKRVNLPYALERQTAGAEAVFRLPVRSTLTLGYEFEGVDREHREANTSENTLHASWRTRLARWMSFEARYLQGFREGDDYNNEVTHEGYWYTPSEATDNNNPRLTFDNHPDMRRYDVSDRTRRQFDARVSLTPMEAVAVSAFVRYRSDDFDSEVRPAQPLLETTLAERTATTPGVQLGRIDQSRTRVGLDVFTEPAPRVTFNAFVSYDLGRVFERSLEFNENNKANPSAIATADLGPWTRGESIWTADHDDSTWSAGAGASFQVVPDRVTLFADYTASIARLDLDYQGFGRTNWNGTPFPPNHQFFFTSPPTTRENLHVVNLRVEIPIRALAVVAGYSYENYDLEDWQQGGFGPWVEAVGAATLLRDTSRSFQWGNRLFNLGTYLAPSYQAHIGFVGFRYRF